MKGRAANPYRGTTNDEPHVAREPAPPRPLAEIEAALAAIPNVTTQRTANRFDLRRGPGEALVIACREYAGHLALADLTLVGNEFLAILALEALVPLFGPIELTIAEYRDLVDDSEPGVAYARYQQYRLELAQKHQRELEKHAKAVDAARLAMADNLVRSAPPARSTKLWALAILGLASLLVVGIVAFRHYSKQPIGERCTSDSDCRSGECIERPYGYRTRDRESVCSRACWGGDDCPDRMVCQSYSPDFRTVQDMCTPTDW